MKRVLWAISVVCTVTALGSNAYGQIGRARNIDKVLNQLVEQFTARANQLARQYEQAGEHEKAKSTLQMILRINPGDKEAAALLNKIAEEELTANRTSLRVLANAGWQDTGIRVFQGKPVAIEAKGTWTFRMAAEVTPEGVRVPKELAEFPLGSLVGAVVPAQTGQPTEQARGRRGLRREQQQKEQKPPTIRPFLIGSKKVFNPPVSGTLYLRMHDSDETDNAGSLVVTVSGQISSR